jgi:hypothetical protein
MMANLYAKFKEEDRPTLGALLPLALLVKSAPTACLVTVASMRLPFCRVLTAVDLYRWSI